MSLRKYVEPELGQARVDAQWVRIAERMPAPRAPNRALRWSLGGAFACALVGLALFAQRAPSPSVWEGSLVASDDSPVELSLSEGSHVELDPRSQVGLLQSSAESLTLELGRGSARFDVAKQKPRRFVVRAGSVEVRVTGTQFRVARSATPQGERVRVTVEEGSVEVHRDGQPVATLREGERWSTLVERPEVAREESAPDATPSEPPAADEPASDDTSEPRERRARPRPTAAGEAEELFERANVARRAGLLHEAAALFEELVQKHGKDRHAALSAFELGRMRMDSFGDMRGAVTALERALSLDERRAFAEDAMARLALAHDALGDAKSCARVRERYLARYPEGVHAQYLSERCRDR